MAYKVNMFLSTPPSRVATTYIYPQYTTINEFLSTPPSRVATLLSCLPTLYLVSFYPRHPRGWRRTMFMDFMQKIAVSIHATLAGGDRPTRNFP